MPTYIKYCILTLIGLFSLSTLYSQEQISDIETIGVFRASTLVGRIGFAQMGDENYMLVEHDSLTIYNWNNDEFVPFVSVRGEGELIDLKDKDRSLMAIRDGKYYRYINNGIQIIDIATGDIDFDSTYTCEEFEKPLQAALVDSTIYLFSQDRNSQQYKLLDFTTGHLVDLGISRPEHQIGHLALITTDTSAVIKNLLTGEESEMSSFPAGIAHRISSRIDTSFIIIDKNDKICKLSYDDPPFLYDCRFFVAGVENITINCDQLLITSFSEAPIPSKIVSFIILDLNSCSYDVIPSIRLEEYQQFLKTSFITNANSTTDFTVVNIELVRTISDGEMIKLTYVIDHINNTQVITDKMTVTEGSPFRYNDNIYFHGFDIKINAVDLLRSPIFKVDSILEEFENINSDKRDVVMGFPIDGSLICATNTREEDIKIWKISDQDEFEEVQSISLSHSHGLFSAKDITIINDNIYYTTSTGFYRIEDTNELLLSADHDEVFFCIFCPFIDHSVDRYSDMVRFLEDSEDRTILHTYDTKSEELITYDIDLLNGASFQENLIGPYQIYNTEFDDTTLEIFDIRDGSIFGIPGRIRPNLIIPFENFSLFRSGSSDELYSIDYNSGEIISIPFDFANSVSVFKSNEIGYIADRLEDGALRIRRLKSLTDIETIYESVESASIPSRPFYNSNGSNISYIAFSEGDIDKILLDDSENSRVYTLFENEYISDIDRDQLLIQNNTSSNGGNGVIGRIRPFEDVERIQNDFLTDPVVYEELIGDTAFFLFRVGEDSLRSIYYNLENRSFSTKIIQSDIKSYRNWIRLDGSRLFFMGEGLDFCGIEPRMLDLDRAKVSLLSDINRGPESSLIQNIIKTKKGIFFTAIISGDNRQWFKLSIDNTPISIESVNSVLDLEVFPNPTNCNIRVRKGFQSISVFSETGVEVIKLNEVHPSMNINLGNLISGTYIVLATDFLGRKSITKVVKI